MWRITNIVVLLACSVFLVGAGLAFYEVFSQMSEVQSEARRDEARALPAEPAIDNAGKVASTHAIAVSSILQRESWGAWRVIALAQKDRPEQRPRVSEPSRGQIAASNGDENNLLLQNVVSGQSTLLFDRRVAIRGWSAVGSDDLLSLVVAFADKDTNSDGKLDRGDAARVSIFRFADPKEVPLTIDSDFLRFWRDMDCSEPCQLWAFTTDEQIGNEHVSYDRRRPFRAYLIDPAARTATPVIDEATLATAQAIIDGASKR